MILVQYSTVNQTKMNFMLLLFFIINVLSLENKKLSIVLLTHPKKRPELTRTMQDITEAIKNCPNGLIIDEMVFVKGCIYGCQHDELERSIKEFEKNFPNIKIAVPNFTPKEDDVYMSKEWSKDFYESLWQDIQFASFSYSNYIKHMTVNFYFLSSAEYIYNKNTTDFVLFIEDDVIYDKNTFSIILNLMYQNDDEKYIYSKISNNQNIREFRGMRKGIISCRPDYPYRAGFYGVLRSMEQLRIFIVHMKFSGHSECGDTISETLCTASSKSISLFEISRHFGHDPQIPK